MKSYTVFKTKDEYIKFVTAFKQIAAIKELDGADFALMSICRDRQLEKHFQPRKKFPHPAIKKWEGLCNALLHLESSMTKVSWVSKKNLFSKDTLEQVCTHKPHKAWAKELFTPEQLAIIVNKANSLRTFYGSAK